MTIYIVSNFSVRQTAAMYIHNLYLLETVDIFMKLSLRSGLLASWPVFPKEHNLRQSFQTKEFLGGKIPGYEEWEGKGGETGKEEKQIKHDTVTELASLT